MKKIISIFFYCIFIFLYMFSPIIFPVIGICGYLHNYTWMLYISGVYSLLYLFSNIMGGRCLIWTILLIIGSISTIKLGEMEALECFSFVFSLGVLIDFVTTIVSAIMVDGFSAVINKFKKSNKKISDN